MNSVYILMEYTNDAGWVMGNIIGVFGSEEKARVRKEELEMDENSLYMQREYWLEIEKYLVR